MKKTVSELKQILQDGMLVLDQNGFSHKINIYGNNLLRFQSRQISWKDFHSLLVTGTYELIINKTQNAVFDYKKTGRGGPRIPGPGKKLGRNPIDPKEKKKPISIALTCQDLLKLESLRQKHGLNRSKMISLLINNKKE